MTMYDSAGKLKEEFKELFPSGLSLRQIWFIVKMCKSVRLYCKSNVAFDNFFNAVFREIAEFKRVPKQDTQGRGYTGLQIKMIRPDDTSATEVMEDSDSET